MRTPFFPCQVSSLGRFRFDVSSEGLWWASRMHFFLMALGASLLARGGWATSKRHKACKRQEKCEKGARTASTLTSERWQSQHVNRWQESVLRLCEKLCSPPRLSRIRQTRGKKNNKNPSRLCPRVPKTRTESMFLLVWSTDLYSLSYHSVHHTAVERKRLGGKK